MKYRMGTALLSLAGVFVSAYLWMFKHGYIGSLACGTGGCATVQLSEYSKFLGVDVALLGFVGYALLLGVAMLGLQPGWQERREPARAGLLLSAGGVLFAGYLTGLELFVIHAICRWCVGSAVIIVLVFLLQLLDHRRLARS
ncbi:MAG TPA: vitamin K epoxide reductase family protein [Gemmatimonadales bacterium]|nr:vitamin K epoxide reductase family protein [Gemmatimonadales bacterium]HRZ08346.1 vitamin K epoxide reductase family protein [Gemmatimonadales bacterium]